MSLGVFRPIDRGTKSHRNSRFCVVLQRGTEMVVIFGQNLDY